MTSQLQLDQRYRRWGSFANACEAAFEPLTDAFTQATLETLDIRPGDVCPDVAAGTGSAALLVWPAAVGG